MELKLVKNMSCRLAARGKWGNLAAAWMGLSFFLRMVFYFGLTNFNDLGASELIFRVTLPLLISVAFILVLKIKALGIPLAAGVLSVLFAVNYFLAENMSLGGVVSGILVLALSGMILAAVLGYIPQRKWLLWAAVGVLAFRLIFVDLLGYILPLGELKLFAYIPLASNASGAAALSSLSAALRLRKAE